MFKPETFAGRAVYLLFNDGAIGPVLVIGLIGLGIVGGLVGGR